MNDLLTPVSGLLPLVMAQIASPGPDDRSLAVWWLLGLAAAAVIFNQLSDAWRKLTGRFKEREQPGPHYVLHSTCIDSHNKLEATLREIDEGHEERTEALRRELKADTGGVHKRVDEVLKAVSRVEGMLAK